MISERNALNARKAYDVLRFRHRVPMSKAQSEALDTTMNNCEAID